MDRRAFLGALGIAPVLARLAIAAPKLPPPTPIDPDFDAVECYEDGYSPYAVGDTLEIIAGIGKGQIFKVTGIQVHTITFDPPLHLSRGEILTLTETVTLC